jgi:hypothetical protein
MKLNLVLGHDGNFWHWSWGKPLRWCLCTVKRVIAHMSLQRPVEGQILTVKQMHETASKNITGIQEEVEATKSELEERFRNVDNLPGTRSFHSITALNNHIQAKVLLGEFQSVPFNIDKRKKLS